MNVYDEAVRAVPNSEKMVMYEIYIARAAELFGVPRTRQIYEVSILSFAFGLWLLSWFLAKLVVFYLVWRSSFSSKVSFVVDRRNWYIDPISLMLFLLLIIVTWWTDNINVSSMVTLGILPSAFWLLSCSFYFYDRFALWQYCTLVLEYNFATTFHLANNLSCLTLVLLIIVTAWISLQWFFHTLFYYPSAYNFFL